MERLPTELLIDIFTWCTHSDALTAITLCNVCTRWKAITDQSPCLFQFIVLDDHSLSFYLANRIANFYLARSCGLPFDVEINVVSRDSLLPLLSPFLNHLNRWRSCTIGGTREEAVRFGEFWDRGNGEPKLEELEIDVFDVAEMDAVTENIQAQAAVVGDDLSHGTFKPYMISLTSNLLYMTVVLSKLPSPLTLSPLRFVTLSIKESPLTLDLSIRPDELLRFLTICPELEVFSFTGSFSELVITLEDARRPPPIVSLPRLHTLVLNGTLATRIILSYLHTPALRELCLKRLNVEFDFPILNPYLPHPSRKPIDPSFVPPQSPRAESPTNTSGLPSSPTSAENLYPPSCSLAFDFECALEDGDSDDEFPDFSQSPHSDHATGMGLRSLLSRSSPPLSVLEMDYADMRTKDFAWVFSHARSLTDFRIVASDMADRVVRMLAPDASGAMLLPRLRSLELVNCQRLSGTAIVEAVRERERATDSYTAEGRAIDAFPLEDVGVVDCAGFSIGDGLELAEVLGDRVRFH
jgi:hypothetical protein